uniref:Uncharacterized protein n=1 Tax=Arundo donax TaxID=35708 RepID=A0A0A8YXK1_ARUDO
MQLFYLGDILNSILQLLFSTMVLKYTDGGLCLVGCR